MAEGGPHDLTLITPKPKKSKKPKPQPTAEPPKQIAPNATKLHNDRMKNLEKLVSQANLNSDLDQTLETLSKLDQVCAMAQCKTKVQNFSISCDYCNHRYCTQHHLPEIHGCGAACAKEYRRKFKAEATSILSNAPQKKSEAGKSAVKLEKKLKEMEAARKKSTTLPNTKVKEMASSFPVGGGKPKISKQMRRAQVAKGEDLGPKTGNKTK